MSAGGDRFDHERAFYWFLVVASGTTWALTIAVKLWE